MVQLRRATDIGENTGWQLLKVALPPKVPQAPKPHVSALFLAAALLNPVACQFNSLNQQKTNLAEKSSVSFIFNKPSGITEEPDKQQSDCLSRSGISRPCRWCTTIPFRSS